MRTRASPAAQLERDLTEEIKASLLLSIDHVYFEMVYLGISDPSASPPATLLPTEPADALAAGLGALVRAPSAFFGASHSHAVACRMRDGLSRMGAASAPPVPSALATRTHGWCTIVAREHCRQLQALCSGGGRESPPGDAADGVRVSAGAVNTLLATWRERMLEAIDLLQKDGLGVASAGGYDAALPPSAPSKCDDEPPAPPLVQRWRKMDREWPCWSLAFAVPSEEALALLSSVGPIVEMGSGTGYWAQLLLARGVKVSAFDAVPTPHAGHVAAVRGGGKRGAAAAPQQNEFHGDCPSFVPVRSGGPPVLADSMWSGHTLLLCYPPKGQPMAAECVQHFCGDAIAHVGEWRGDTGHRSFEESLAMGWELSARMPLPNWGDTVEDLTLWRRRKAPLPTPPATHPVLACDACGKRAALAPAAKVAGGGTKRKAGGGVAGGGTADGAGGVRLRRCRYCRLACYCSAECEGAARKAHEQYHAVKQICLHRALIFNGRDFYDL